MSPSRWRALALSVVTTALLVPGAARTARAQAFTYDPPGKLAPSTSGRGRVDNKVYAPTMRFPMEVPKAFANSQVYGRGGGQGPGGGQCDAANYTYPWHDNYCESRSYSMPLCPAGTGHQGQDIRPGTCVKDTHWAVAAEAGTITSVGSYSVYLTAADGTRFDYLHMSNVQVKVGDRVTRGQRMGKVSNVFDGTPTTIHLHFNLRQSVTGVGAVYVPPYLSLVEAYKRGTAPPDAGAADASVRDAASSRDASGLDSSTDGATPAPGPSAPAPGPDELPTPEGEQAAENGGFTSAPEEGCNSAGQAPSLFVAGVAGVLALGLVRRRRATRR